MKELSIEEKAKAYDDALERAKEINNEQRAQPFDVMTRVFPELKESEDELKWLTEFIKEEAYYLSMDIRDDEDRIKLKKLQRSLTWLEKQKEPELPEDLGEYIAELSKQFPEVSFAKLSRIAVRVKNWLEKQGEQNHADKIEPKFKVGDWITNGIETVQITGYDIDYGYQVDYKGKLQHRDTDIIEKEYHLWTTQDVKPDDVLVVNWDNGYKLDVEKKELKKIEQNPAWSEEDEKMVKDIIAAIDTLYYHGMVNWLKSLKDRVQPKQEWSEDDEKERKRVVGLLEGWLSTFKGTCYAEDCKCGIAWLEKQGQKPQSYWKPNECQMKVLDEVLNFAANHESPYWNYYIFETLNNLIRQLKKLREE